MLLLRNGGENFNWHGEGFSVACGRGQRVVRKHSSALRMHGRTWIIQFGFLSDNAYLEVRGRQTS